MKVGDVYATEGGPELTITSRYSESRAVGEVWQGRVAVGSLSMSVLVTPDGLTEGNYSFVRWDDPSPAPA